MKPTFLEYERPLLTAMLKKDTPEEVMKEMAHALEEGAEAFGLQTENFKQIYHEVML